MVLTARNKDGLEETGQLINSQAPGVSVHVVAGDIGNMASLPSLCTLLLERIDTSKHKLGLLVNNAGTMNRFEIPGDDPQYIQDYMGLNFTSMVVLTTHFLSAFPPPGKRFVINISSLLASVFVPRFSLYSASKAARTTFMGVLGADQPDVRLLSYCPGTCDTDMYKEIPKDILVHITSVSVVVLLTSKQSIEKLVRLLKEDKFKNSSVIDYHDDEQQS